MNRQSSAEWSGYQNDAALDDGPLRLGATLFRIDQEAWTESEFHIPDDRHLVCVHLSGSIDWAIEVADRRWKRPCLPDTLCLAKAGETARASYRNAHASFIHFYLPTALVTSYLEADGLDSRQFELLDPANTVDTEIALVARRTADLLRYGPGSRLLFDAAGLTLVDLLLRQWSNLRGSQRMRVIRPSFDKADWRVRRVIDYLDANLAEDVGLAELAALVGLTTSHLTTLFRASAGEPPHRWLMRRRFERACEMLNDPRHAVTEVALACGFASSQHLATVFQRRLGITPSAYRRARVT